MKRHPLDPVSLVFGGLFAALGTFLVTSTTRWETASASWAFPALLIVMGGAILWSTLRRLAVDGTVEDEDETDASAPEYPIPAPSGS